MEMPQKSRWDASLVIAMIAVLISSISAFISLKESQIMHDQQKMLSQQQEASVWPYLQTTTIHDFKGDTAVIYRYMVTNKGVGPAIIDDVLYLFDEKPITGWGLEDELAKKHPTLVIEQQRNAVLDGVVLAPGESHTVIVERISKAPTDSTKLSTVLAEMNFKLTYCYCSVYGKCWKVKSKKEIIPSDDCKFREEIR